MSQWKHISIARLSMTNFKRFYGTHEIELLTQPDLDKTLVLIGGDNGRGKTSIHEAINYVFYEDGDLPGIQTRPSYLRAVSDRLNRRALDEGQTDYSVAVDLIVSDGSAERQLHIERSWEVDVAQRQAVSPVLVIQENGRPIDWIEDSPAAYQDFLRHVLPPRIAPFFLFDGERIQQFAEEDGHDRRMVDAIEDILHISVYKMLRDDLKKFVIDHISKYEVKAVDSGDFFELQEDEERIERELDQKRDRLADVEREIEEAVKEQRRVEDELRRIASPYASKRDELILEKQRLEGEIESVKADLQTAFQALPILLTGKLWVVLQETLEDEQQAITSPEQIANLQERMEVIEERVFVSPDPPPPSEVALSDEQTLFYRKLFQRVAKEVLGLGSANKREPLHDLSAGQRESILRRLVEGAQKATLLRDVIDRRERLVNELRDVDTKIMSTSDDPRVTEIIDKNRAISEQIGKLEGERTTLVGSIQRLEADLAIRRRQIADRQEQRKATTEAMKVIKLARKAQAVLDAFIHELAPEKLAVLKDHFDYYVWVTAKARRPGMFCRYRS